MKRGCGGTKEKWGRESEREREDGERGIGTLRERERE